MENTEDFGVKPPLCVCICECTCVNVCACLGKHARLPLPSLPSLTAVIRAAQTVTPLLSCLALLLFTLHSHSFDNKLLFCAAKIIPIIATDF